MGSETHWETNRQRENRLISLSPAFIKITESKTLKKKVENASLYVSSMLSTHSSRRGGSQSESDSVDRKVNQASKWSHKAVSRVRASFVEYSQVNQKNIRKLMLRC